VQVIVAILLLIVGLYIFFFPTVCSAGKKHRTSIFILNIVSALVTFLYMYLNGAFLIWIMALVWVIALAWSFFDEQTPLTPKSGTENTKNKITEQSRAAIISAAILMIVNLINLISTEILVYGEIKSKAMLGIDPIIIFGLFTNNIWARNFALFRVFFGFVVFEIIYLYLHDYWSMLIMPVYYIPLFSLLYFKTNKKVLTISYVFASIFIVLTIFNYVGMATIGGKDKIETKTTSPQWQRIEIGKTGLSINAPFMFIEKNDLIPGNLKKYIVYSETHIYTAQDSFISNIGYLQYIASIKCDLDGAVNGAINAIENASGVSNFIHNNRSITVNGKSGTYVIAKYSCERVEYSLKAIYVVDGSKLWTIMITYPLNQDNYNQISNRIINSLTIK